MEEEVNKKRVMGIGTSFLKVSFPKEILKGLGERQSTEVVNSHDSEVSLPWIKP